MNNPKVSIIVPTYNVEKYLAKCLESLLAQDLEDIAIYVIDDGSTDGSSKIAKEYAKKDSRINYIRKENGGYGSVLNYAFQIIETDYFLICDPDDWLTGDAVFTLYNEAVSENLDLVVADRYDVFSEISAIESHSINRGWIKITPNIVYTKNVEKFGFLDVSPHAKLYKAALVDSLKLPENVAHTDFMLYLFTLTRAKRAKYISKPLAYYLQDRPGNTATDRSMKSVCSHLAVWNETYSKINEPYLYLRLFNELKMIIKLASSNMTPEVREKIVEAASRLKDQLSCVQKTAVDIPHKRRSDLNLFARLPLSVYLNMHVAKNRRSPHA